MSGVDTIGSAVEMEFERLVPYLEHECRIRTVHHYVEFLLAELEHHFEELKQLRKLASPHFYSELVDLHLLSMMVCRICGITVTSSPLKYSSFEDGLTDIEAFYLNQIRNRTHIRFHLQELDRRIQAVVRTEAINIPGGLVSRRIDRVIEKIRVLWKERNDEIACGP